MSNLSNLYISQSYFGIINLEDSEQPLVSQSGDINLQDGIGDNLGLKINAQSLKFTIVNDLQVDGNADFNGNIDVSGSFIHTGSIDVLGNVTVEGNVTAHTGSFDTLNARVLNVLIESSSVILSSGSNQIGDEITDVQTIVGITTISGSLGVTGNQSNTGSLFVSNEISSSTINGIGNVTAFSSSVDSRINNLSSSVDTTITNLSSSLDSRLDYLEGPFSTSVDARLVSLENFSSSLVADFVTDVEYSASIAVVTSSLESQINTKLASSWTGSVFQPFSSSVDTRINSKLDTSTFTSFSSSVSGEINSLATTGSNTFSGSQIFSGSVVGDVHDISIVSSTASLDCSIGNFFTLTLPSGSTRIETSNIQKGKTLSLKLQQSGIGSGSAVFDSKVKFPSLQTFLTTTDPNSVDIVTFVSYDTGSLFAVETKNLV